MKLKEFISNIEKLVKSHPEALDFDVVYSSDDETVYPLSVSINNIYKRLIIMNKIIKDGKTAVLVSGGFGAGFSTWNKISPFEPVIVQMLLDDQPWRDIVTYCEAKYPDECTLGVDRLHVEWVEQGVAFSINEYDGSESLYIANQLDHVA